MYQKRKALASLSRGVSALRFLSPCFAPARPPGTIPAMPAFNQSLTSYEASQNFCR